MLASLLTGRGMPFNSQADITATRWRVAVRCFERLHLQVFWTSWPGRQSSFPLLHLVDRADPCEAGYEREMSKQMFLRSSTINDKASSSTIPTNSCNRFFVGFSFFFLFFAVLCHSFGEADPSFVVERCLKFVNSTLECVRIALKERKKLKLFQNGEMC